jgi:hypothetical protein
LALPSVTARPEEAQTAVPVRVVVVEPDVDVVVVADVVEVVPWACVVVVVDDGELLQAARLTARAATARTAPPVRRGVRISRMVAPSVCPVLRCASHRRSTRSPPR